MPTSATEISAQPPSKRPLSDSETSDDDAQHQTKRTKTPVASGSGSTPAATKDKKRKRTKKKKRKTPVVATASGSAALPEPSGSRLNGVGFVQAAEGQKDVRAKGLIKDVAIATKVALEEIAGTDLSTPPTSERHGSPVCRSTSAAEVEDALVPVSQEPQTPAVESQPESNETAATSMNAEVEEIDATSHPAHVSVPALDKGKARAVADGLPLGLQISTPSGLSPAGPSTSAAASTLTTDIVITQQLELLTKHQTLLTTLAQSITCQICLELLHKPFALAPCGHVACYTCLVSWFSAPPPGRPEGEQNRVRNAVRRNKTCPHCRADVRARPAEVWAIKDAVSALSRSGLGPIPEPMGEAGAPIPAPQQPADPWAGIFRPEGPEAAWANGANGGPEDMGVYDEEDAVWRCIACHHEIVAGECTACGREYEGHDDYSDMSLDEEDVGYLGVAENMLDELDAEDLDAYLDEIRGPRGARHGRLEHPWFRRDWDEDEDDDGFVPPNGDDLLRDIVGGLTDDSESDHDDGEGHHDPYGPPEHERWWFEGMDVPEEHGQDEMHPFAEWHAGRRQPPPPRQARIEEVLDDEDDEDDESYEGSFIDDDDAPPRPHPARGEIIDLVSDDKDVAPVPRRGGRRHHPAIVIDDEADSEDDNDDEDPPIVRRGRSRGNAPVIVVSSDEDEGQVDEDDHDEDDDEEEDAEGDSEEAADEVEDDGSIRRVPMRFTRNVRWRGI